MAFLIFPRRMRLSQDAGPRVARLAFIGLLTIAWSGAAHVVQAQQAAAATPMTAAQAAAAFKPFADKLSRLFDAAEAADRDLPQEEFDIPSLAKKLGGDPGGALTWVRDHTFWAPYQGALRGAAGVLLDRTGNSLDRSLLLATILQAGGNTVRIARGRLTNEQAETMLPRVRPLPADRVPGRALSDLQAVDTLIEKYGKPFQLDAAELRKNAEAQMIGYQRFSEELAQRVADQAPALRNSVGKPAGDPTADLHAWSAQCIRDHAWVQVQSAGNWVDLDPLLPDAKAGQRNIEPAETLAVGADGPAAAIKPADWNEVELRVVVERADPRGATRTTVLKQVLRPAALFGRRIAFSHINVGAADYNPFTETDPVAAARASALSQHEWAPMLQVGDQQIIQGSFDATGKVDPKANLDAMARTGKAVTGALGGALGALGGLDAPPAPGDGAAGSDLVGEWLEFDVHAPGRPTVTHRREVFDLFGPAAQAAGLKLPAPLNDEQRLQRGLALYGQTEILIEAAEFNAPYLEHLTNQCLLANRGILLNAMRDGSLIDRANLPALLSKMTPTPGPLYSLAVARHRASPAGADTFIDRPDILTYRRTIIDGPNSTVNTIEGFDIVANGVGVRPESKDPFSVRMLQGVVDTNAEAILMNASVSPDDQKQSTADDFARARAGEEPWTTVRTAGDAVAAGTKWPQDAKTRLNEELHDGFVAVVPAGPTPFAGQPSMTWWRVDPRTGETLGVNDRGQGTSAVEYAQLLVRIALVAFALIKCLKSVGKLQSSGARGAATLACAVAAILSSVGVVYGNLAVSAASVAATAGGAAGAAVAVSTF